MQGLDTLYAESGRGSAWRRLVEAVTPDFVDLRNDLPLQGRENEWQLFTSYRFRLALEERNFVAAERLGRLAVDRSRESARAALATPAGERNHNHRAAIRSLAVNLEYLSRIQRERGDPACAENLLEAFDLYGAIGGAAEQVGCAFNLGAAYSEVAALRNFDDAERWLQQGLRLVLPGDKLGRGKLFDMLGKVSLGRFNFAVRENRPWEECRRFLLDAEKYYKTALQLFPPTAIGPRSVSHNQLGNVYNFIGDVDRALEHYQQDIRYSEQGGDIFGAGQTRTNVAVALMNANRLDDARAYAEAALANFRSFGDRAADITQRTEQLLARISQAAAQKAQP